MSGVLNDCDALLQGASVRIVNPANAWINLATSAPGFHLNAAGVADLAVVTVTADLFGLDEAVAFSAVGGTLSNANGKSVDVTYAGSTAVVTATVVSGGEEFKRSIVIPVLRDGAAGAAGQVAYTWIKYADTAAGAGLSDDPAGKTYIGLAYNKSTSIESTTPGDYAWSQLKGGDGVAGAKGADGITYYTWIKYADQADGTGLYDAPNTNTLYIGIAVNRTTATESTTKTDYVWSRFKGEQGVAGAPTYTWIKYADSAAGAGLSDDPTGKPYIGFAYNKPTATESTTATDYTWALIKGTDGQAGGKGADGATLYTWIKYSDVADGTGLYDLPTASTLFIGIATNKTTATESTVKTDYVWSKFKGDQGVQGPTTYTWVKYADSAAGAGLSDDPIGKAYIGFAYNKATASESTTATDYTWSLIKGTDGQAGGKGADGATLYTWIKYSDNADGTGLYDLPTASTQYLGIAVNKPTATESTVKTDYVWSKFRGADGVGTAGARGAGHYYVAGSSWSDVVAQAACPGGPVTNDVVTISSGTFVMEKRWTGSAWVENGVVINGKLIVPDSILASAIDTRGLTVRAPDGTILLGTGVPLAESLAPPGTRNSDLKVGGRNLFPDGDFERGVHGVFASGVSRALIGNIAGVGTFRGNKALFMEGTGADMHAYLGTKLAVVPGREYRISFYSATITGGGITGSSSYLRLSAANGAILNHFPLPISGLGVYEWRRQVVPFACPEGVAFVEPRFGILGSGAYAWMAVDCVKIEEGNIVTDWSPAPEDVDAGTAAAALTAQWPNVGGPGRPSDNATVGATIGINLGGQFNSGNVPSLFVPGSITDTQVGGNLKSSNWNGSTATDGTGWLLERATGNLYANLVKLRGAVMGGAFTSYDWPASGNGFYSGPEGFKCGSLAANRYFNADQYGDVYAPNFTIINGVPTFSNGNIVNPNFQAFTASLSGGAITSSGANGTRALGSRQIIGSGGKLPYRSISWVVTDLEGNSGARTIISGENTDSVSVSASGTNASTRVRITGTITDANGLTASASFTSTANFGSV